MKPGTYNGKWSLMLPDHIAEWDAITDWEQGRFDSMARTLKHGEVLFEVGAEHGSHAAVFARHMVGGDALVLFEPSADFWPNIRMTWEANGLAHPRGVWAGFVDATSTPGARDLVAALHRHVGEGRREMVRASRWPDEAAGDVECPAMAYRKLGEHDCPAVSIDDYVAWTGIVPAALSIDVEGAELRVLQGAVATIHVHRPRVWVSIHGDLIPQFGAEAEDVHTYFEHLGYLARHLGTDHEQHWLFYDPQQRIIF